MKLKIGNKLFCKENYDGYSNFIQNYYYEIEYISNYDNISSKKKYKIILLRGDNGFADYFTTKYIKDELYLWDFFSIKKLRKEKLKQINNY